MKLNIINVLNEIANEESTMVLLVNPDAFWNAKEDMKEKYMYEKHNIEYENENVWDLIEWNEKHGYDYDNILKLIKKVPTFDEWLESEMAIRSKYIVYKF